MIISFNSETRSFSGKGALTKVKDHIGNNSRVYIDAAAGVAGGVGGAAIARSMAKKKAIAMGLEPGTPEYKKFIRKYMAVGAGIGVAGGAAASELGRVGYRTTQVLSKRKDMKDSLRKGVEKGSAEWKDAAKRAKAAHKVNIKEILGGGRSYKGTKSQNMV